MAQCCKYQNVFHINLITVLTPLSVESDIISQSKLKLVLASLGPFVSALSAARAGAGVGSPSESTSGRVRTRTRTGQS